MVKNTKGGSGHKSQARKFVDSSKQQAKTRIALEDGEIYAQVSKILGNGMCHVLCQDSKTRLCMIRGKFRGRGKRDNMLSNGKFILVGIRDYESGKEGKLENCDLLDVYTDQDKERLKNQVDGFDWKIFNQGEISKKNDNSESDIHFTNDNENDYDRIMNEATTKSSSKLQNKVNVIEEEENDDEDEINVDDI
jgi:translation initiation factor 1A